MKVGPRAIALIKYYEKCRLRCYMPTPHDRPTIGWGTTGADVTLGLIWTQEQCDTRFGADLDAFARGVTKGIGRAATTAGQFGAMVSLSYNIGLANFAQSSVLTNHRAQHHSTAALAFGLWNKQRNGQTGQLEVLAGLTKRRKIEALLYTGDLAAFDAAIGYQD